MVAWLSDRGTEPDGDARVGDNIDAHRETRTLSLKDPEIFNYPLLYIIEVSWLRITDVEARNLRAFLDKGGFVIVDDFKTSEWRGGRGWEQFADNMRQVMPDARFVDLDVSHPIFHQFFSIGSLDIFPQAYNAGRPIFAASSKPTIGRGGCRCSSATTPTSRSSGSGRAAASARSTKRTRPTSSASTRLSTASPTAIVTGGASVPPAATRAPFLLQM